MGDGYCTEVLGWQQGNAEIYFPPGSYASSSMGGAGKVEIDIHPDMELLNWEIMASSMS